MRAGDGFGGIMPSPTHKRIYCTGYIRTVSIDHGNIIGFNRLQLQLSQRLVRFNAQLLYRLLTTNGIKSNLVSGCGSATSDTRPGNQPSRRFTERSRKFPNNPPEPPKIF